MKSLIHSAHRMLRFDNIDNQQETLLRQSSMSLLVSRCWYSATSVGSYMSTLAIAALRLFSSLLAAETVLCLTVQFKPNLPDARKHDIISCRMAAATCPKASWEANSKAPFSTRRARI